MLIIQYQYHIIPYAKSEKEFASDSDQAIRAFWKWWSVSTKSGRDNNPKFKVKS